jgi:hypothetical protein
MLGHLGFSYMGLLYMLALLVPNILWTRHQPQGYDPSGENRVLLIVERVGQALCTATVLVFSNTNPHGWEPWIAWLFASVLLMALYECYWIRYFRGNRTMRDFYRPFLGIPAPGATLPVVAFLFLGIYGRLLWLIIASVMLGIGHIGIHRGHIKKLP